MMIIIVLLLQMSCLRGKRHLLNMGRGLHSTAPVCSKFRYKMMDGAPLMPKNKAAEIRLLKPNKAAGLRFWWKEDGTIWHWTGKGEQHLYFNYKKYQDLVDIPVQVTDPERVAVIKQLLGPYHLYRQTPWFRHDHEYEAPSTTRLSRQFLGLPPKS